MEIVGEQSGDEFEIEAIEESSSEDEEPLAARSRRPSTGGRRPPLGGAALAAGGAAAAAAGGAAAAAAAAAGGGGGGQRRIDSFMQRVPRGQASALALAGPAAQEGRQQAGAMAMRPASAEEQQLDMLDYANRMVGAAGWLGWRVLLTGGCEVGLLRRACGMRVGHVHTQVSSLLVADACPCTHSPALRLRTFLHFLLAAVPV